MGGSAGAGHQICAPGRGTSGLSHRAAFHPPRTPGTAPTVAAPAARPRPSSPPPRDQRPPLGQEERGDQRAQRNLRPDAPLPRPQPPTQPQITMQDPQLPPVRDRGGGPPRRGEATPPPLPQAPGVRGFRDITADADDLGRAAAQANRAARKTYANVPSPSPEFDRLEPSMENRGDPDAPYSYDESAEEAERYAAPPPAPRPRIGRDADREPKKRARTGAVFPFKSAIAIGVVLILVGAGILWGRSVVSGVSGLFKSSPVAEAQKDNSASLSKPKIPDRVGQPSSSEQVAPVAQRVVLYDEDPSDPKGKQYVGSVIWRTEPIKASGNQKADTAVRADIDIPDRKFKT